MEAEKTHPRFRGQEPTVWSHVSLCHPHETLTVFVSLACDRMKRGGELLEAPSPYSSCRLGAVTHVAPVDRLGIHRPTRRYHGITSVRDCIRASAVASRSGRVSPTLPLRNLAVPPPPVDVNALRTPSPLITAFWSADLSMSRDLAARYFSSLRCLPIVKSMFHHAPP